MKKIVLLIATIFPVLSMAQSLSLDDTYSGDGIHYHSPNWDGMSEYHEIRDMVPIANDFTLTLLRTQNMGLFSAEIRRQEASGSNVTNNVYYDWGTIGTDIMGAAMDKVSDGVIVGSRIYPSAGSPEVQLIKLTGSLTSTGVLENNFGNSGVVSIPQPNDGDMEPVRILEKSDNSLYVISEQFMTGSVRRKIVISKLTSSGVLDSTFGTNGHAFHVVGDSTYAVRDAVIDANDNIYVCGGAFKYEPGGEGSFVTTKKTYVAKFLADGTVDQSFGDVGSQRFTFSDLFTQQSFCETLKLHPSGGVMVFGSGTHQSNSRPGIAKLDASGYLDAAFGTNGLLKTYFNLNRAGISDAEVLSDGNVLILGRYRQNQGDPYQPCVFIINGSGQLITDAHPEGFFAFGGEQDNPAMMSLTPENKVLVHGFEQYSGTPEYRLSSYRMINTSTASLDELEAKITLYPNPTKDVLSIRSDANIKEVIIMSTDGKVVHAEAIAHEINISSLQSGVYIVTCTLENNQFVTKRIIKN